MRVKDLKKKSAKRIESSFIQSLGIQSYGCDNLYPQTLHNIIQASATGAECVDRYADFIEGNGFLDVAFSEYVVNRRGQTADDIHTLICHDLAEYGGFALHLNYSVDGKIVELNHVPYENCRMFEEDANGYMPYIAVHEDWTGQKTRGCKRIQVNNKTIDKIHVFNPNLNVVLSQIDRAGGIDLYKGQIFYFSMAGKNTYPTGKADRVATEMSTEEGLANVKYRNARCNFLPAGMMITKVASDYTKGDVPYSDDSFGESIKSLQGDVNASKIIEVTLEEGDEKPEFVEMASKNYDKEFTVTDASVTERIYSAFGQEPWYCIRSGKVGFSGNILEDAFEYYNSIVSKEKRIIERAFTAVFSHWYEVANASNDFSVQSLKYVRNASVATNQ